MLASISSRLFAEWMAYAEIEPFGDERADIRNAIACAVAVRSHGGKGAKVSDFLPKFTGPADDASPAPAGVVRQTVTEMRNAAKNWASSIKERFQRK